MDNNHRNENIIQTLCAYSYAINEKISGGLLGESLPDICIK